MALKNITEEFPGAEIPTIFADTILNFANSNNVVKFYLVRTDPSFQNIGDFTNQPFAQLVMPIEGFVNAFAFLEQGMQHLMSIGLVPQETLDLVREQIKTKLNEKP